MKIVVVGGGAAGFFGAISAKEHFPNAEVCILEKSNKVLSKVKISGGGRCNVTHACYEPNRLATFYPRGEKFLKKAFQQFDASSTVEWFKKRNIRLVTLPDNCIFPASDDSQTIIDCFLSECQRLKIEIKMQMPVTSLEKVGDVFVLEAGGQQIEADRVLLTTGGQPKNTGLSWLKHPYIEPVPSLFTFNMPTEKVKELMGIVVDPATVRVEGTKLAAEGPLLITHWGMSGPAVLKLSAWGARILQEKGYNFHILVNWLHSEKEETLRRKIEEVQKQHGLKMLANLNPFPFPNRLWLFLLEKIEVNHQLRWSELGKKQTNRLVNLLINDRYEVSGKTTFKEEFVTAGGISLAHVNPTTLESTLLPGVFFAGELLDIDGITGGFNFQSAWTTSWIAGKHCGLK